MDFLMSAPQQFFQSGPPGVFTPVFSATLAADDSINPATVCEVIAGPFSKSGSQVRLTLQGGATGGVTITEMWMGSQGAGNAYNFDGTQVQVKFGGATSFAVPAAGSIVTDSIPYNFVAANNFVIAFFYSVAGTVRVNNALAGATRFVNLGANTASVTSKAAGYATNASYLDLINKIEVFG